MNSTDLDIHDLLQNGEFTRGKDPLNNDDIYSISQHEAFRVTPLNQIKESDVGKRIIDFLLDLIENNRADDFKKLVQKLPENIKRSFLVTIALGLPSPTPKLLLS